MWKRNLDKGNVVGTVLIDFKKAFDSVDHSILSYKMDAYSLQFIQPNAKSSNLKKELHWPIETCQMGKQMSRVHGQSKSTWNLY